MFYVFCLAYQLDLLDVVMDVANHAQRCIYGPVNPIQDGGAQKEKARLPTSFSTVTSTNIRISLKNFRSFNFNPLATLA